jgi:hypothetical protein
MKKKKTLNWRGDDTFKHKSSQVCVKRKNKKKTHSNERNSGKQFSLSHANNARKKRRMKNIYMYKKNELKCCHIKSQSNISLPFPSAAVDHSTAKFSFLL